MGGGRAPAEKGSTTRQMFKELRSKFNDAAKEPGFFDKGIQPEIELYCKANADGTQIGDCPFAQFVQVRYCCFIFVYPISLTTHFISKRQLILFRYDLYNLARHVKEGHKLCRQAYFIQ